MKLNQESEIEVKTKKKSLKLDSKKIIKKIILILEDKKCEDIKVLNLENVNSYLSIFVICTVNNVVQARAASRELEKTLKEFKLGPGNQEKKAHNSDNGWILLDLGEIIVHLMTPEKRSFYDLERLWGDANSLKV